MIAVFNCPHILGQVPARLSAATNIGAVPRPQTFGPERAALHGWPLVQYYSNGLYRAIVCHATLGETNYMKRNIIRLTQVVVFGGLCSLTSCAAVNSTANTSRLTTSFLTANSSATYANPETKKSVRAAEEADEQWRTYHFGWYGHP